MTQGEKIDKIYDNLNIVVVNQAVASQKIDNMNEHLTKINGKVQKHGEQIIDLEKTSVKKSWMKKLGAFILGIPAVTWAILQVIQHIKG